MTNDPSDKKTALDDSVVPKSVGASAVFIAGVVLLGWALDIGILKSLHPDWVSMKANTAICFLFAGLSLWLFSAAPAGDNRAFRRVPLVFAILVVFVGLLTLSEYVFRLDLGIDQLIFKGDLHTVATSHIGRMSPITAFNFIFLGAALLALNFKRFAWLGQLCVVIVALNVSLVLLGYLFGVESAFFGPFDFTQMALHTAFTFLLLSVGTFDALSKKGAFSFFKKAGGKTGKEKENIGKALSLTVIVCLVFLGIVCVSSVRGINDLLTAVDLRKQALKVHIQLARLNASALDLERELGGYLLTQSPDHLDRFRETKTNVRESLEGIQHLLVDPGQKSRLNALPELLDKRIALMSTIIDLRDTKGLEASIEEIKLGKGRVIMEEIERVIRDMMAWQENITDERSRKVTHQSNTTTRVIIFGSVLSVLVVCGSGVYIRRAFKAQKQTEEHVRLVVEAAPNAMVMVNQNRKITLVNRQTETLFGYNRQELLGQEIEKLVPERFRPQHPTHVQSFFRNSTVRSMGIGRDLFGLRKDGTEVPIEIGLNPIQTQEGSFVLAAIVDITERKKIETEKFSALDTMAAGVAHELNNPMMGILNYVQYAIKHTSAESKAHPVLQDAERETRRCSRIIQDILVFARSSREDESAYRVVYCGEMIQELLKAIDHRIQTEGVSVRLKLDRQVPPVRMHMDKMGRVFSNLITNALDAMKDRPEKILVIEGQKEGGSVRIDVTDTGSGIAPADLTKIFDPFFTTKPTGQGTGLGLSISRSIVNEHRGKLSCRSELGKGSTFSVHLPI